MKKNYETPTFVVIEFSKELLTAGSLNTSANAGGLSSGEWEEDSWF